MPGQVFPPSWSVIIDFQATPTEMVDPNYAEPFVRATSPEKIWVIEGFQYEDGSYIISLNASSTRLRGPIRTKLMLDHFDEVEATFRQWVSMWEQDATAQAKNGKNPVQPGIAAPPTRQTPPQSVKAPRVPIILSWWLGIPALISGASGAVYGLLGGNIGIGLAGLILLVIAGSLPRR